MSLIDTNHDLCKKEKNNNLELLQSVKLEQLVMSYQINNQKIFEIFAKLYTKMF